MNNYTKWRSSLKLSSHDTYIYILNSMSNYQEQFSTKENLSMLNETHMQPMYGVVWK